MEHIYQEFNEWFDYQNLYRRMVEIHDSGAKFVELGSLRGASGSFMAVEIANSGKAIDFHCVDHWLDESVYQEFLKNTKPVSAYMASHRLESGEAAKLFEPESIDFLFIDAGHDYHEVKRDIDLWLPLMKPNGIISGHDYQMDSPGVIQAVIEAFPNSARRTDVFSWVVQLKDGKPVKNL